MRTPSGKTIALRPWWGSFAIALGEVLHFRIGPFALWVERLARELRVSHKQHEDPLDLALEIAALVPEVPEAEAGLEAARFAISASALEIAIEPLLADRPVVVRTHEAFNVLGNDEATLFVTTPVWIRVAVGAPKKPLFERASHRPSDTWFGASTREGELCYAGTTTARLNLEELTFRPARATTRVHIVNEARTPLALDRINLPAPALSVFAGEDHRLWTEPISIRREADGEIHGVSIGPNAELPASARLAGPRQGEDSNLFSRAFKALLG